jgi:hypothetical protein
MGQTIPAMQARQLLASSCVSVAAAAMISFSFAVSPPLTLVPPRPVPVDVGGNAISQQDQPVETVGVAISDSFERRWQAAADAPLVPAPRRDPLEGLIGGLLAATEDAPQLMQIEPIEPAPVPQPEQQEPVKVALQEPPARSSDVCARHGLRRVEYTQNRHRYWRCAGRR